MVIKAKLGIITINYDVLPEHRNVCNTLISGSCPIVAGETYVYKMDMPLNAPVTNVNVRISIQANDDNNNPVVCGSFDAYIAKS